MKLGKDFWFWVKVLLAILKAILAFNPVNPSNPDSLGFQIVKSVTGVLVQENEDDDRIATDVHHLM